MATAVAGIWNQASGMYSAATTKANDTASSSTASDENSASISANDFLTLLVTEMKNQDPTADTDPNEYVNQLVQINSLEQLISINQTLTADSTASASSNAAQGGTAISPSVTKSAVSTAAVQDNTPSPISGIANPGVVSGNLSSPLVNPAAIRVASSLETH